MKTIKVIELLDKIANGEEVPKRIKYGKHIYEYEEGTYDWSYYIQNNGTVKFLLTDVFNSDDNILSILNDEVEIIEEKKIPEKLEEIGKIDYNLGYIDYKNIEVLKNWLNKDIQSILNELDLIVKNQNQLIDFLESKEKGE